MKAVVQRVLEASVEVNGEKISAIKQGLLVLLGIAPQDCEEQARWMARKIAALRIFEDEEGKMNRSVKDVGGEVLTVSQFTLLGDAAHGARPSFTNAARPEIAEPLYEKYLRFIAEELGEEKTGHGRFGADMKVALVNDGPVTILIER